MELHAPTNDSHEDLRTALGFLEEDQEDIVRTILGTPRQTPIANIANRNNFQSFDKNTRELAEAVVAIPYYQDNTGRWRTIPFTRQDVTNDGLVEALLLSLRHI